MKRKSTLIRILIWMLISAALLSGCGKETNIFEGGDRGEGEFSFLQQTAAEDGRYMLNTASRRIHLADCVYAKKTSEENRLFVNTADTALREGYTPCARCLAPSSETDTEKEDMKK